MIYVCTWNYTLNNVRFLVSDMYKKHGATTLKLHANIIVQQLI